MAGCVAKSGHVVANAAPDSDEPVVWNVLQATEHDTFN
jgi:hypothetical protein